jgi:glutamate-ammonia-ligase adenylyltransferase
VSARPALERAIAEAPDPELARVALARVLEHPVAREAFEHEAVRRVGVRLLGFSRTATDLLVRHPEEAWALADVGARGRAELEVELAGDLDRFGPAAGLRRFRRRAMLRIAARDLAGADVDSVVAEITRVADACLEAAVRLAGEGLAVIALGKLGGGELNYASDVDVLFVHAEAGAGSQERSERLAAEVIRLLAEPTDEGIALRVDPTLRPGGRSGPLSRSLAAMLAYYERDSAT